jgi:CheY-like chemotaxis protein
MARLLVVDDDVETLAWMAAALTGAGHEVQTAPSVQRALSILDHWMPNLALVDILMPEIDGWAFHRMARRYNLPVLFVSVVPSEGEALLRGCNGFIRKPTTPQRVRDEVDHILGHPDRRMPILLVDDEPDMLMTLAAFLKPKFDTYEASNGQQALDVLRRHDISLVITDVRMPVMDGRELVRRIRQEPRFARLPILVQTADREAARLPVWSELQVEQVMTKDDFVDWLLSRIDWRLAEQDGGHARPD